MNSSSCPDVFWYDQFQHFQGHYFFYKNIYTKTEVNTADQSLLSLAELIYKLDL